MEMLIKPVGYCARCPGIVAFSATGRRRPKRSGGGWRSAKFRFALSSKDSTPFGQHIMLALMAGFPRNRPLSVPILRSKRFWCYPWILRRNLKILHGPARNQPLDSQRVNFLRIIMPRWQPLNDGGIQPIPPTRLEISLENYFNLYGSNALTVLKSLALRVAISMPLFSAVAAIK